MSVSVSKSKPNKRKTSEVWEYFTKSDRIGYALCNYCGQSFFYQSSTSNLKRHFHLKHKNSRNNEIGKSSSEITDSSTKDFNNVGVEYEVVEDSETKEQDLHTPLLIKKAPAKYLSKRNYVKSPVAVQKKLNTYGSNHDDNTDMIQEAINILSNVARKKKSDNDGDEFSQFGKYVSDQLRQLPALNALQLQEKIYCLLTRERIAVMRNATELHLHGENSFVKNHCPDEQQDNQLQWSTTQIERTCSLPDQQESEPSTSPVPTIIIPVSVDTYD